MSEREDSGGEAPEEFPVLIESEWSLSFMMKELIAHRQGSSLFLQN